MRNTKEVLTILTAINCINYAKYKDETLYDICEYAFERLFNSTARLSILQCLGKDKERIINEVEQMLNADTKYKQFIDWKNFQEEKRNEQTTKTTK